MLELKFEICLKYMKERIRKAAQRMREEERERNKQLDEQLKEENHKLRKRIRELVDEGHGCVAILKHLNTGKDDWYDDKMYGSIMRREWEWDREDDNSN